MRVAPLALALLLLSPLATADDLDPSRVPADARWLVHVDLAAALQSELFAGLQELESDLDFNGEDWDEIRNELGIDPREDLHSVTIFGVTDDPEEAVIQIDTTVRAEQALDALKLHLQATAINGAGAQLYRWQDPDGGDTMYSHLAKRKGSNDRLLMVSSVQAALAESVRVLRGEAPSMADSGSHSLGTPRPGAFVFVSASEILSELLAREADSHVARFVQAAEVQIGENGGNTFAHIAVKTGNRSEAQQIAQVLQGALALAGLVGQQEPELAAALPMLSSIQFKAEGERLTLHFERPTGELLEFLESAVHSSGNVVYRADADDDDHDDDPDVGDGDWY